MAFGRVTRHELRVREVEVTRVQEVVEGMLRVTLAGPDLDGFTADGPADHVKVYFPDPATGVLAPPVMTADGSIQRTSTAVSFNRDYTPRAYRPEASELDIDFLTHPGAGLAADWARNARPGQRIAFVGPRGSRLPDADASQFVLIGDETALPAIARWLTVLPPAVPVSVIAHVEDDYFDDYLTPEQRARGNVEWLYRVDGPGQLDEAVRSLNLDPGTRVWGAGEATELVPVRRYLRQHPNLERNHVVIQGYWKRGIVNLDHHAPIDPTDP